MKRKNWPKCSFLNLMNMQTHLKINRKVAFFIKYSGTKKSKSCCHPPFQPPNFCCHSLKLLSPTLPKLMNWILLSPPPLSSDPDNPPKFGTCTGAFLLNYSLQKHEKMRQKSCKTARFYHLQMIKG